MNKKEFRIGNYIAIDHLIVTIDASMFNEIDSYRPIELSEGNPEMVTTGTPQKD